MIVKDKDLMNIQYASYEEAIDKFQFLNGINRALIPSQIDKMSDSVTEMGILRPVIVAKLNFANLKGEYIIDGQHLFKSLIRLKVTVPYKVIPIKDHVDLIKKIAKMNNSSKTWTLEDYVNSWGSLPHMEDYRTLYKAAKDYNISFGNIASIYSNRSISGISTVIKRGDFKIVNRTTGDLILSNLVDIFKIIPKTSPVSTKIFITVYSNWFYTIRDKYDHNKFLKYVEKYKSYFSTLTEADESAYNVLNQLFV